MNAWLMLYWELWTYWQLFIADILAIIPFSSTHKFH